MKKTKVLFCIRDFKQGGIPKSLASLLQFIDTNRYEIDVFCADHDGEWKTRMVNCRILDQNVFLYLLCTNYRKQQGIIKFITVCFKSIGFCLKKIKIDIYEILKKHISNQLSKNNYDVVVAYAEGFATEFSSNIRAEKRIAWFHMNYERYLDCEKPGDEFLLYEKYNIIVCPSNDGVISFSNVHPVLSDRLITIKNLLNIKEIVSLSQKPQDDIIKDDCYNIISVGRICHEKGFYHIPEIVSALRDKDLKFKWYIVGSGPDKEVEFLKDEIVKYGIESYVSLLGAKENPYPYIYASDLLVVLSVNETFSYVMYEAKCLQIPMVSTNFDAVREIMDERYGLIVPIEQITIAIEKMITDKEYYNSIKYNLKLFEYDNDIVLAKIYDLL